MKRLRFLLSLLVALPLVFGLAQAKLDLTSKTQRIVDNVDINKIVDSTTGLRPNVVRLAMDGYLWAAAHGKVERPGMLTVVDLSLPSNKKRLWVINLKENKVIMHIYTTHGKHSGLKRATHFSNRRGSDESSLGIYVTDRTYSGKHGKSLRLSGLEKGINNNAYRRALVIHSAWYATPKFIHNHGRAGRSWGCFAVNPEKKNELISLIKDGSVIFAYAAPEKHDPNLHIYSLSKAQEMV